MKNSHSRTRARSTPPASAAAPKGPPVDIVSIAVGPNTTGPADQVASVHVDEEGNAPEPASGASEVGNDEEG